MQFVGEGKAEARAAVTEMGRKPFVPYGLPCPWLLFATGQGQRDTCRPGLFKGAVQYMGTRPLCFAWLHGLPRFYIFTHDDALEKAAGPLCLGVRRRDEPPPTRPSRLHRESDGLGSSRKIALTHLVG